MLFQKNIEPRCTYCQRGTPLDEEKILCTKQGVVAPGGSCRSFKYDPLKRVPPPPVAPDFSKLRTRISPFEQKPPPPAHQAGAAFRAICVCAWPAPANRRSPALPRQQP